MIEGIILLTLVHGQYFSSNILFILHIVSPCSLTETSTSGNPVPCGCFRTCGSRQLVWQVQMLEGTIIFQCYVLPVVLFYIRTKAPQLPTELFQLILYKKIIFNIIMIIFVVNFNKQAKIFSKLSQRYPTLRNKQNSVPSLGTVLSSVHCW